MDTKKIVPLATAGILGAVWLFMTTRGQTPPQALNQAIIAAVGSLVAGTAVGGAMTGNAQPKKGSVA
jgi:hypothetical protein